MLSAIYNLNYFSWKHLICACSLSDLEDFIKVTESGLGQTVEEGDYNGLVEIMGNLMAVKERQITTDDMFEPLLHTIDLLKTYKQELPDAVYKQLEVSLCIQCLNFFYLIFFYFIVKKYSLFYRHC